MQSVHFYLQNKFFSEYVKGYQTVFLQKIHLKTGVESGFSVVNILVRILVEDMGAVLEKDNRIDLPHIPIGKIFAPKRFGACVLPHDQI